MKHDVHGLTAGRQPLAWRAMALLAGLVVGTAGASCQDASDGAGGPPGTARGGQTGTGNTGGAGAEDPDAATSGDPDAASEDAKPPPPPNPQNLSACEHLQKGPFEPLMGTEIFNMTAPALMTGRAYRLTMPKRGASHVTFTVTTPGNYVIFTSTSAALAVFDIAGLIVPEGVLNLEIPECVEVKGRHPFKLAVDTHIIRLGSADSRGGTVDVVITPAP